MIAHVLFYVVIGAAVIAASVLQPNWGTGASFGVLATLFVLDVGGTYATYRHKRSNPRKGV